MTADHLVQHFHGFDFFDSAYREGVNMDRELMREHWFAHRELIIQKYHERGIDPLDPPMPWSFYQFEEPETVGR